MSGQGPYEGSFQAGKLAREIERRMFTNEDFARLLDTTEKTVRRWRSGEAQPQRRHIRRLAQVLERDPQWFYERDGNDEPVAVA